MSARYKIRDQQGLNYVTCTVVGWVDLFSRRVYRDIVLESWRYCQEHKGLQIHAYTIMPNHLHAILSCNEPFYLESVMRDWKAHTARQVLMYLEDSSQPESRREWLLYMFSYFAAGKKDKQTYQVWQNGNHPIELYSAEVIEQKLTYIHENAVRAGWVDAPEQWLYSSAAFYGGGKSLIPITPLW